MTHYSLEEWTDYVRGLVDTERQTAMDGHASGCAACARHRESLAQVARTLAWDARHDLSARMLQRAHQLSVRLRREQASQWRTLLARLTFDSAAALASVGVRAAGPGMRHLVFEAPPYLVHVQWEIAAPAGSVSLVGRIETTGPSPLPPGIPVRAVIADSVAGESKANQFGEFVFDCAWDRRLTLVLSLAAAGVEIEIPLGNVSSPGSPSGRVRRRR